MEELGDALLKLLNGDTPFISHPFFVRPIISNWDASMSKQENPYERKMRMLRQLSQTCAACTCCELGRKDAEKDGLHRDPHVLSNMAPSKIFVCGQNPGYEELKQGTPFVGASGKNFDKELAKHGVDRSQFYITNAVRCFTTDNAKPSQLSIDRCRPFLMMEIGLMNPKLIVTLGAVAFGCLCPGCVYDQALGNITTSNLYGTKVFAILHPSPLNLTQPSRRVDFERQIAILCKMVKRFAPQDD
jgi:uracil-DNA glycosylase family 4